MYKELENDIGGFKRPGHGYLIGWARQGEYTVFFNLIIFFCQMQDLDNLTYNAMGVYWFTVFTVYWSF